jgi:2-methylcitrate dehydratase PrpD
MSDSRGETITDGRLVTRELAEWVAGLNFEDLPTPVADEAGRVLVDFLGECLFVGAKKSWGQAIAAFCAQPHNGGAIPEATIIALGKKTMASRAALANGMMALGFEYADWGAGSRPYPFAVTGALALAETRRRSGKDLALSIAICYEVMGRVFRACFNPGHGGGLFYTPAVYGTLGAAAGCARMLGLSPENTNYALGLGAAFTGGTFQGHEEGAWQRSLNGGMAGERAVTAALMAETGFKATTMGLEGVQGFAKMFSGGKLDASALLDGIGESFIIMDRWVKGYPMNATLHAPVEALLKIMREHQLKHTDIEEIRAGWQKVEAFLAKHKVSTVVSAQASLPFALSVAAVRGKITVDEFTDETVADPVIQALIPRITVYQDSELYERASKNSSLFGRITFPGKVTIRTKDGREFTDEVLYPKGNPGNPMTEDEFKGKFMNMAERVLGRAQGEELYKRARALTEIRDISELAPLFAPK